MRANGRSPTSAIAPPAPVANNRLDEAATPNSHRGHEDVNRAKLLHNPMELIDFLCLSCGIGTSRPCELLSLLVSIESGSLPGLGEAAEANRPIFNALTEVMQQLVGWVCRRST